MNNSDNNTEITTEDRGSLEAALRRDIQWKQELLDQVSRKYNSLHELASGLIDAIKDDANNIDDVKTLLEYDRDRWAKHDISVDSEYEVCATLTFNVNLTVKASDEDAAIHRAEIYLGDHHEFNIEFIPDDIELDSYDLNEVDAYVNN